MPPLAVVPFIFTGAPPLTAGGNAVAAGLAEGKTFSDIMKNAVWKAFGRETRKD